MTTELALIAHELGGVAELAELLGVDVELLDLLFSGAELTRRQLAIIKSAYANLQISTELEDEDIDIDYVEERAKRIDTGLRVSGLPSEDQSLLVEHVASSDIDDKFLHVDGIYDIFPFLYDLTVWQMQKLTDWLRGVDGDINILLEHYLSDIEKHGGIWTAQLEGDSEFWRWYRETFYANAT